MKTKPAAVSKHVVKYLSGGSSIVQYKPKGTTTTSLLGVVIFTPAIKSSGRMPLDRRHVSTSVRAILKGSCSPNKPDTGAIDCPIFRRIAPRVQTAEFQAKFARIQGQFDRFYYTDRNPAPHKNYYPCDLTPPNSFFDQCCMVFSDTQEFQMDIRARISSGSGKPPGDPCMFCSARLNIITLPTCGHKLRAACTKMNYLAACARDYHWPECLSCPFCHRSNYEVEEINRGRVELIPSWLLYNSGAIHRRMRRTRPKSVYPHTMRRWLISSRIRFDMTSWKGWSCW